MTLSRLTIRGIAFWAIASVVAVVAGQGAVSQTYRRSPNNHLTIFSANDGEALAKRFDQALAANNGVIRNPEAWSGAARGVLRRNPLEAKALRIAALSDLASESDISMVRKRMHLAESISARDLQTQLWLLEDAVARGDVAEVLQHYDRALSVRPNSKALLFPVLVAAISDPLIRADLVPYIRRNRPWAYEFIGTAVDQAVNTADVADLLTKAGGSRTIPANRPLETMMLKQLVAKGQIGVARRYAENMASSSEARTGLNTFGFSTATMAADLRPFTWSIVEDLSVQTSFDEGEGLVITAGAGASGVAADRVIPLRPGKWRFEQRVEMPRLAPMAAASWTVSCLSNGGVREILKQAISEQPGDQRLATMVDVANDCGAVHFRLTVHGADAQEDSAITIRGVGLTRIK